MTVSLDNIEEKVDADFSVLYSGGLDSTAVALYMGRKFTGRMHLFTLHHNYGSLFPKWSQRHVRDLQKVYGEDRVLHTISNITTVFKEITIQTLRKDFFGKGHFVWCLGCMLSILTKTIINNLVHRVPYAFVASSVGGEYAIMSMPTSIETKREVCLEYGIDYRAPLLEMKMTKPQERVLLKKYDIWPGLKVLKGVQGVQPICLPGLMHTLDNMFDIHTEYDPNKVRDYILDKKPIIRKIVEAELRKQGLDLDECIAALKAHREDLESQTYPTTETEK